MSIVGRWDYHESIQRGFRLRTNEITRLLNRAKDLATESPKKALTRGLDKLWVYAYTPLARISRNQKRFNCIGIQYPYFTHAYNATWRNERCVEIAVAQGFLDGLKGYKVLELGNVMSYYDPHRGDPDFYSSYVVVDKYERSPSVLNIDFVDYQTKELYDAFISISTFEHIGWDETPKDEAKVMRALKRIDDLVARKENVLVSFPLGYHPTLDAIVRDHEHGFKRYSCLVRTSRSNDWVETDPSDALRRPYGSTFEAANALFVGVEL